MKYLLGFKNGEHAEIEAETFTDDAGWFVFSDVSGRACAYVAMSEVTMVELQPEVGEIPVAEDGFGSIIPATDADPVMDEKLSYMNQVRVQRIPLEGEKTY